MHCMQERGAIITTVVGLQTIVENIARGHAWARQGMVHRLNKARMSVGLISLVGTAWAHLGHFGFIQGPFEPLGLSGHSQHT